MTSKNFIENTSLYLDGMRALTSELILDNLSAKSDKEQILLMFIRRIKDCSRSISILMTEEKYYDVCILSSHIVEGLILFLYLNGNENGMKDFLDFSIVPYLTLDNRENNLSLIEERNINRFLNTNAKQHSEHLSKQYEYVKKWSKKNLFDKSRDIKDNKELSKFCYELYSLLCKYKHFEPYYLDVRYNAENYDTSRLDAYLGVWASYIVLVSFTDEYSKIFNKKINLDKYVNILKNN